MEFSDYIFVYRLVLLMMEKLEPERKCCRRVGGVLVERTAADFIPAIADTKTQVLTWSIMLTVYDVMTTAVAVV